MAQGVTSSFTEDVSFTSKFQMTKYDDVLNIIGATVTMQNPAGDLFTNEGNDTVLVEDSMLFEEGVNLKFYLGSGDDTLTVKNSTLSAPIATGSGNDIVTITGEIGSKVYQNSELTFGNGNDLLELIAALENVGTIDFGSSGSKTLRFDGGTLLGNGDENIKGITDLDVTVLGGTLGCSLSFSQTDQVSILLNGDLLGNTSHKTISLSGNTMTLITGEDACTNVGLFLSGAKVEHKDGGSIKLYKSLYEDWQGCLLSARDSIVSFHSMVLEHNTIYLQAAVYLENTKIEIHNFEANGIRAYQGNGRDYNGGAIMQNGGIMTLTDATFSGNYVDVDGMGSAFGGAIYQSGGTATIANAVFTSNRVNVMGNGGSAWGGAICLSSAILNMENVAFYDNTISKGVYQRGGAMYVENSEVNYRVTAGQIINNTGNAPCWLYLGNHSTVNFTIESNALLSVGDDRGLDGIDIIWPDWPEAEGNFDVSICKNGEGVLLINSPIVWDRGLWTISEGTLELARIAREIELGSWTIEEKGTLALSVTNDTINIRNAKSISGFLDVGDGKDVFNTNGFNFSEGTILFHNLSINGGRVGATLHNRSTTEGCSLTLNGAILYSDYIGTDLEDEIIINQESALSGIINMAGGNNSISVNGTLNMNGIFDAAQGINSIHVNGTLNMNSAIKIQKGGETSVYAYYGSNITDNTLTVYADAEAARDIITLDWNDQTDLDKVRILVSSDSTFETFEFNLELYNQTKAFTLDLQKGYFIQFQAQDEDGWKQRLLADTTAPNQVTGLTISGSSLSWDETHDNPGGNGVMQYHVEVASDASFSTILQTGTATSPEFVLNSSAEGTVYVRVKAVDYTGNIGAWSETLIVTGDEPPPTPTKKFVAGSDIDGNGVSDVLFVWTGEHGEGNYQHGYWMNGTDVWQSADAHHPSDWDNLGCYDMIGDGKADSVLFGNVNEDGIRGAYIGYYTDGDDLDDNWVTIGHLDNIEVDWKNKVGNLTGNEKGANSIVWYAAEMHALGAWKDGKEDWVSIAETFGGDAWTLVGCGDFDGDGRDSIVMSYNGGQLFYTADIDGTTAEMGDADWSGWEVRAIGDFMGDGKDDLVLFHPEYGSMVMIADGKTDKGNYIDIGQLSASDWFVVGCGDYDGDRKDDLLVRQYSTGWLGYYSEGIQDNWNLLGRGVGMEWTVIA